ncbi:MAG: polysaccharide deacetylase family protein [Schwartzia sp.]|nr:polysaccharide deacetylase family protein [Schwartzia sp. (in: firmicutes)]
MRKDKRRHASPASWGKRILLITLAVLLPLGWFLTPRLAARMGLDEANGVKIVVLNYHKIENLHNSLSVLPEDFDRQMRYLQDNGFHVISPAELHAALAEGAELPENPVLITFDDGYQDNYKNAYPILQKYGFRATIFVVTSFLDQALPGYLTWAQAAEMEASGLIDIESHTVTHGSMTELSDEQLRYELAESKRDIEKRLGKQVEFIAYPTGTYNLHIASLVKEAGYKGAFTIKYGNVDAASNLYALERVPIFHTANTYRSFLERLQYVPVFEQLGWNKS